MEILNADVNADMLLMDYAITAFKLVLACSPILAIVLVLLFANESDEEEQAKREHARNCVKR